MIDETAPRPGWIDQVFNKSCAAMSEIPDGAVNCVVTSPPFETQRDYGLADPENVGLYSGVEFIAKMRGPMKEIHRVLRDDGSAFINFMPGRVGGYASPTLYSFPMLLVEVGFKIVQTLHWVKTNARPTGDPRLLKNSIEPIFHVAKGQGFFADKDAVRRPPLYAGRDPRAWKYNPLGADGGNFLCPALDRLNRLSVQDVLGMVMDPEGDIFPLRKTQNQSTLHPAAMPPELAAWLVRYGSRSSDLVLDPFLGGGEVACQAKALGRHWVGYELSAKYAALAQERIGGVVFGEALDGVATQGAATNKPSPRPTGERPAPAEKECRFCKKPFLPKRPWQESCSSRCRYTHFNRRNTRIRGRKNHGKEADVDRGGGGGEEGASHAVHLDVQEEGPTPEGSGPGVV